MNIRNGFTANTRFKSLTKNKTFGNYSYLVFSFIAIIIFAVFAIRPTIKSIIDLNSSLREKQQTLQKLKDKSQSLNQAIASLNAIKPDTKLKLYALLPDSTNLPCFLDFINSLPSKAPLTISGEQVQQFSLKGVSNCTPQESDLEQFKKNAVSQTTLAEIVFGVNTNGDYNDQLTVLDALSHSTRLTSIQNVIFTQTTDSPLTMIVNGKIFFYK